MMNIAASFCALALTLPSGKLAATSSEPAPVPAIMTARATPPATPPAPPPAPAQSVAPAPQPYPAYPAASKHPVGPASIPGPPSLPYTDRPAPPGYHVDSVSRRALWVPGVVLFSVTYGVALLDLATVRDPYVEELWLMMPMAGPFVARTRCYTSSQSWCSFTSAYFTLLGIGQVVGVGLTTWGLTWKKKRFVRNDLARSISFSPGLMGGGAYGMSMGGRF